MLRRAGLHLPLPAHLRRELARVPQETLGRPVAAALPQIPVPPSLVLRLRRLADEGPSGRRLRRLPFWLRSARYAVAASFLLTVAAGSALGGPAALGRDLVDSLSRPFGASPASAPSSSGLPGRLETFAGSLVAGCGSAGRSLHATVESLGHRLTRATEGLLPLDHSNRERKR